MVTVLLSVLEAAFEILIPLCMAGLIDEGVDMGDMAAVWKFGVVILALAAMQLLTGMLSAQVAAQDPRGFFSQSETGYVRQCADLRFFQYR